MAVLYPLLPAPKRIGVNVNARLATGAREATLRFFVAPLSICLPMFVIIVD